VGNLLFLLPWGGGVKKAVLLPGPFPPPLWSDTFVPRTEDPPSRREAFLSRAEIFLTYTIPLFFLLLLPLLRSLALIFPCFIVLYPASLEGALFSPSC